MQNPSKLRFHCVLVAWLAIATAPLLCAQNVQRWIHPGYGASGLDPYSAQNQVESQYATALRESDVFQFPVEVVANIGYVGSAEVRASARSALAARIQLFKKYGIRIAIADKGPNASEGAAWNPTTPDKHYCELQPGICTPQTLDNLAQQSAIKVLWKIQPIYDAGGTVSYITVDGAGLADTLLNGRGNEPGQGSHGCNFSLPDSTATLVKYIHYIHTGVQGLPGRPEIKFGLHVAMPNVRYRNSPSTTGAESLGGQDFYDVLNAIVAAVKDAGETVWYVHSDSPYNLTFPSGTSDYLDRILSLRDQCPGLGLRFGAIFNTENSVDNGYTNDTLDYIRRYRGRTNGQDPDDFVIENWFNTPSSTFPECPDSSPGCSSQYSFMNLVKKTATPTNDFFWGDNHAYSRQLDGDIFDWQGYLTHDPVLANWVTSTFGNQQRFGAEWHWLNLGVNEGRRGSGRFSARYYLNTYSLIAAAYGSQNYSGAIDHFFRFGRNEGRHGTDPTCSEANWGCGGY
jgi:hypothetical protein